MVDRFVDIKINNNHERLNIPSSHDVIYELTKYKQNDLNYQNRNKL